MCFFFFFTKQNVRSRKIGCVSEVLHARTHLIGIGWAICPDLSGGWDLTKYGKLKNFVAYHRCYKKLLSNE